MIRQDIYSFSLNLNFTCLYAPLWSWAWETTPWISQSVLPNGFLLICSSGRPSWETANGRTEERILFWFPEFAWISLTAKGSHRPVSVSPTSSLHHITDGCTVARPPPHTHQGVQELTMNQEPQGTFFPIFRD